MVLILLLVVIMPVQADELSDQQSTLDQINQQLEQQQSNLNQAANSAKTIMGQVQGIEQQVASTQNDLQTLDDKITFLQNNITVTDKQIKTLQNNLDKQTQLLGDRLVVIYEQGDSSYLQVLLGATDLNDFITRYELLKTIIDQDRDLIDTINANKKDLDNKMADLEVQKSQLEVDQASQAAKQAALNTQLNEQKAFLDSVEKDKDKYAQEVAELKQASDEAQAVIQQLEGKGGGAHIGTGTFTWPTPGYTTITEAFGWRIHPILKVRSFHTGVDIGAPYGARIVAADGGAVIYAGWLGAYGNAIIIDHGGGMSTLYGHQSQLLVGVGDVVFKGQQIGKAGSTGLSTGPHLHFEIRQNGTAVNPLGGYI
jgi:murein DD-endopeptidase MepM/ murein hydrolase activator NlpD